MSDLDISSLTDYTSGLISNAKLSGSAASSKSAFSGLGKDSTDEELLGACKEFEAYLWEQVYKEVDKTSNVFGTESDGSYAGNMVNMFSDNLIQEVSKMSVSGEDNSLAMQLYQQLKRNLGIGVITPGEIDAATAQTEADGTAETDAAGLSENAAANGVIITE